VVGFREGSLRGCSARMTRSGIAVSELCLSGFCSSRRTSAKAALNSSLTFFSSSLCEASRRLISVLSLVSSSRSLAVLISSLSVAESSKIGASCWVPGLPWLFSSAESACFSAQSFFLAPGHNYWAV
jgi:hypothetical protein